MSLKKNNIRRRFGNRHCNNKHIVASGMSELFIILISNHQKAVVLNHKINILSLEL